MRWIDIPPVWLLAFLIIARSTREIVAGLDAPGLLSRGLGALLVVGGLVLMALAVREMQRHRTTPIPHQQPTALVTTGVFRLSRNPIYLGDAMALTGAILWWGVWPALVLVPAFIWLITERFVLPEEERLRVAFGAEFAAWARETRRWI